MHFVFCKEFYIFVNMPQEIYKEIEYVTVFIRWDLQSVPYLYLEGTPSSVSNADAAAAAAVAPSR